MIRMRSVQEKCDQEIELMRKKVTRLEKEMEDVIIESARMVEEKYRSQRDFSDSFSQLTIKRDEVVTNKCKKLEHENISLN